MLVTGALRNLPTFDATITKSSNKKRLEKCVRRVVLLHNWELRCFFSFFPFFFFGGGGGGSLPTIDMVITSYF